MGDHRVSRSHAADTLLLRSNGPRPHARRLPRSPGEEVAMTQATEQRTSPITGTSDAVERKPTVTAVFDGPEAVEQACEIAAGHDYAIGDVNVVMSEETRRHYLAQPGAQIEIAKHSAEGGALGGPTGGRVGIAIAIAAAVGAAIAVPGLGFAAGPLAVAAASAGAAGLAAGLVGAIAHWGLPEPRVAEYEQEIAAGRVLIGVQTRTEEDARAIAREWEDIGGRAVHV
jgi:hypothetical protein